MMPTTHSLLTIAGSDPSGGAGVQVDLQVFRDFGFHGLSVFTALVCQNTAGARGFEPVAPALVRAQLETLLEDIEPAGVKVGMLPNAAVVEVVADILTSPRHAHLPLVLDPVLASSAGQSLVETGCVDAMRQYLLGRVQLLTPNLQEAGALLGRAIRSRDDFQRAPADLLALGSEAVLLKAGHLPEIAPPAQGQGDDAQTVSDLFADATGTHALAALPRVPDDVRGTGCQLSSALLACMVQARAAAATSGNCTVPGAMIAPVERARGYLNHLLHTRRRNIGRGRPVIVRAPAPDIDA